MGVQFGYMQMKLLTVHTINVSEYMNNCGLRVV